MADDLDGGVRAFEEALRWHDEARRPFERARTELCYGEFLRRHQRRVDARGVLGNALATFRRLGASAWARRAEAELQATGVRSRRRTPRPVERLTPQELQVALVVADGATNSEAATRLFLSTKTVEFHLSNAYRKLGIRSRVELARKVLAALPGQPPQNAPGAPAASVPHAPSPLVELGRTWPGRRA
jgi:DNA-binding CsgD family transcriptional regulator